MTYEERVAALHRIVDVFKGMFRNKLTVTVDEPAGPGRWYVDFVLGEARVILEVSPSQEGFGISTGSDHGFGLGPDKVVDTSAQAMATILTALSERPRTLPYVSIGGLREHLGKTQGEVAERLGVQQPAVSKIERAVNPSWSSLEDYVQALGGKLEGMVATIEGRQYIVRIGSGGEEP